MRYIIARWIEWALRRLAERIHNVADRFALCPLCGRNKYSGGPCIY
jgi:hypothetical protein